MSTLDMQYPQVLDECITHLQDGSWSLEYCLAQYPMYADQLGDDLAIFQLTQQLSTRQLSARSVDAMEAKLLQKFNSTATQPKRPVQPVRRHWYAQPFVRWAAGFVFMLLFLIGGSGGTVAASASSLPGDSLYPVKTTWEQVVVVGADLTNQEDSAWLTLAETRADEIVILYEAGRASDITDQVLQTFHQTAETAILYSTPETASAYLIKMEQIRPVFEQAILPNVNESDTLRILQVLYPEMNEDGVLVISRSETFLPQPDITPTVEPTLAPSATFTLTATMTPTFTATPTQTFIPTETRTPTPSRTPTPLPTLIISWTPSPTLTPTVTATQLPITNLDITRTVESDINDPVFGEGGTGEYYTGANEIFIRETEQAIELTRTAISP